MDRGLIRTNPPFGGIVPVTCIMSQRYFSKYGWVTFNVSQFDTDNFVEIVREKEYSSFKRLPGPTAQGEGRGSPAPKGSFL